MTAYASVVERKSPAGDQRLRELLAALEPFLELNSRMPLRAVQALLQVAAYPGLTVTQHSRKSGLPLPTMSRNLLDLGERNRYAQTGLGLIVPMLERDQRERRYYLTKKGEILVGLTLRRIR